MGTDSGWLVSIWSARVLAGEWRLRLHVALQAVGKLTAHLARHPTEGQGRLDHSGGPA